MARREISGRAIALAAGGLGVIGAVLIFGGGNDDPPAAGGRPSASSGPSSPPENVWSPFGRDDTATSRPDGTPGGRGSDAPTSEPSRLPDSTRTPTHVPTSATAPPTDPPPDRHTHDPDSVTQEQVDAAPTPDFDHGFNIEVPDDVAETARDTAWAWLKPRLEKEQWTYLELLEYGVLEAAEDGEGKTTMVAVELGFSGVTGLGQIGVGKIATVWLQPEVDGSWKVTGYRAGLVRDDDGSGGGTPQPSQT